MSPPWLAAAVATVALMAGPGPSRAEPPAPEKPPPTLVLRPGAGFVLAGADAFAGHDGLSPTPAFDAVAADMDRDGDPDLFINRHHRLRPELFENVGGRFVLVNPRGADRSGLYDNPGVPELAAFSGIQTGRLRAQGPPGLYLWHDRRPPWRWQFCWKGEASGAVAGDPGRQPPGKVAVRIRTDTPIQGVLAPPGVAVEELGARERRISFESSNEPCFTVGVAEAGSSIGVELEGVPARVFVGPSWVPFESGKVSLRLRDPHGVAWVQVAGSPEPDLFLSRGALRATLRPPDPPKTNLLYLWQGVPRSLYRLAGDGIVPPDYGRGRQVEWVDVDNDGVHELYVGNYTTPNAFLFADRSAVRLEDRASTLGVAFLCGHSFAWWDWNDDGREDLFFLCGDRLSAARNSGGRFNEVEGRALGLVLPANAGAASGRTGMHLLDFDLDGRLDLWLASFGEKLENRLFLRRDRGFVDASAATGLDAVRGTRLLVPLDADGSSDALSVGDELLLLLGDGRRIEPLRLDGAGATDRIHAAVAADVDVDGATDLVLIGRSRYLALNRRPGGRHLAVRLTPAPGTPFREPIGALVTVRYADGRRQVQRYGSSANTGFSQSLLPLRFGIPPAGDGPSTVEAVAVRWPGSAGESVYRLPPGTTSITLAAPARPALIK